MQETQETWIWSLGWKDSLQEEMVTHSSVLTRTIPWIANPGRLQATELQRVGHDWAHSEHTTRRGARWAWAMSFPDADILNAASFCTVSPVNWASHRFQVVKLQAEGATICLDLKEDVWSQKTATAHGRLHRSGKESSEIWGSLLLELYLTYPRWKFYSLEGKLWPT